MRIVGHIAFCLAWLFAIYARADVRNECLIEDSTIEVIELNHYGNGQAKLIFWDTNGEISDWFQYSGREPEWDGRRWLFISGLRVIQARVYCETVTQHDKAFADWHRKIQRQFVNPFVRVE